jgi:hypothetical protein
VRRHWAVHSQRWKNFSPTKLTTSSISSTSPASAGSKVFSRLGNCATHARSHRSTCALCAAVYCSFGRSTRYAPQSRQWYWGFPHLFVPLRIIFGLPHDRHEYRTVSSIMRHIIFHHHLLCNHYQEWYWIVFYITPLKRQFDHSKQIMMFRSQP